MTIGEPVASKGSNDRFAKLKVSFVFIWYISGPIEKAPSNSGCGSE
jgi:hypothetical protein